MTNLGILPNLSYQHNEYGEKTSPSPPTNLLHYCIKNIYRVEMFTGFVGLRHTIHILQFEGVNENID